MHSSYIIGVAVRLIASLAVLFCLAAASPRADVAPALARHSPPSPGIARPGPVVPIVLLRRSKQKTPGDAGGDVLVAANQDNDPIARRAGETLANRAGYGQFVLRLDRFVKTYLLHDPQLPPARRESLARPAYLFLSDREGGFPAEGFWLEQRDGSVRELRETPFVDLVVKDADFDPGSNDGLEAIYAHELGHLVMAALVGAAPPRAASGVHFSTVVTDGWQAFVEGWGEHFQAMAQDHHAGAAGLGVPPRPPSGAERFWYDRFAAEQAAGCWICPANLRFIRWQGPGEQRLRDAGVRSGLFIHDLVLPARLSAEAPAFDARMYRDVIPPDPQGPLKNGARAMASEGVLASFFYRLASDERLRTSYRDAAFYTPFLADDQAADLPRLGPAALISPAENVYLKVFYVLHQGFRWGDWPAVELLKGYAATFPDEADALYDIFLDVTRGVTVERAAGRRHREPGYLAGLRGRLVAGDARPEANLGPPLWLVVPRMTLGMGVYRYFPVPSSVTFDLNAADVPDLRSVPGVDAGLASSIIAAREQRGFFTRVEELEAVPGVTPQLLSQFVSMRERMVARMSAPNVKRSNPRWLMNWLAPLLKGSYYAAAGWQFGRALVLAGLLYALAAWVISTVLSRHTLATGGAVALSLLLGSAGLYAAGIVPSLVSMTVMGLAVGTAASGVRRLRGAAGERFPGLATVAGAVAASMLIGWMY